MIYAALDIKPFDFSWKLICLIDFFQWHKKILESESVRSGEEKVHMYCMYYWLILLEKCRLEIIR